MTDTPEEAFKEFLRTSPYWRSSEAAFRAGVFFGQARSEGWRPIETAPKDGTIIVLFVPTGINRKYSSPMSADKLCLGFWGSNGEVLGGGPDGWHSVESEEEIWGCGGELTGPMTSVECTSVSPLHWMPLPTPPDQGTVTGTEGGGK